VERVFKKYKSPENLFEGTGADLAKHLLEELKIENVSVEQGADGEDHYNPVNKRVCLSPDVYSGKSLTAITVAAHEVGHVMQDVSGYSLFTMRQSLVRVAHVAEKLGSAAIMAMPVIALVSRSPAMGTIVFGLGISGIALGTLVQLVTLPVELDASFKRALPTLTAGKIITADQSVHARVILKAAAYTYVANSLANLFNLFRWIRLLKR
jgi:Zn-dependent membrane protease YugP